MLIICKVVGDSILYILSCVRNTFSMKIKCYKIIMFEIYKYRIIFTLNSFTSYLLFSFPSNIYNCSKKKLLLSVVFTLLFFTFFCIAINRPCDILQYITDAKIENQRTNGPVNAHLISWPSKAQNIQNLENIW